MFKKRIYSIIIVMIVSTMSLLGQDVDSFQQDYLTALQTQDIAEYYRAIRRLEKFCDDNTQSNTEDRYIINTFLASAYVVRENYEKAYPLLQQAYDYFSKQKNTPHVIEIMETICSNLATCYSEYKEDSETSLKLLFETERYSKATIGSNYGPYSHVSLLYRISQSALNCNNNSLADKYIKKAEKLFSKYYDKIVGSVGAKEADVLRSVIYGVHLSVLNSSIINCVQENKAKQLFRYLDTALKIVNEQDLSTYSLQYGLLYAFDLLAQKGDDKSVHELSLRYVKDIYKFSDSSEKITNDDIARSIGALLLQPADSLGLSAAARSISNFGYDLSKNNDVSLENKKFYTIYQSNFAYSDGDYLKSLEFTIEILNYCTKESSTEEFMEHLSAGVNKTLMLIDHLRQLYKEGQEKWPILQVDDRQLLFSTWERIRNLGVKVLGKDGFEVFLESQDPGPEYRTFKYFTSLDESFIKCMCLVYDHHFNDAIKEFDNLFKYAGLNISDYTNCFWRITENLHRYNSVIDAYEFLDEVESFYTSSVDIIEWASSQRRGLSLWGEYKTDHMIQLMADKDYETAISVGKDVVQTKERLAEIDSTYVSAIIYIAQSMLNIDQNVEALTYIEKCETIAKSIFPRWVNLWSNIYSNKVKVLENLDKKEQLYSTLCQEIDFFIENENRRKINDDENIGWCTKDDIAYSLLKLSQLDMYFGNTSKALEHLQLAKNELDYNKVCKHFMSRAVLPALLDCYMTSINENCLSGKRDFAFSLFLSSLKVIQDENENHPDLMYCIMNNHEAIINILTLLSQNNKYNENEYAEFLISEMHKTINYFNAFPPQGHHSVDNETLIENLAFEYTKIAGDFRDIGNYYSAEIFYKKAVEYLDENGVKGDGYESSLANLSVFYQLQMNDYLSAAECEYLRFKNLAIRKGISDNETQLAFGRIASTITIPYSSVTLKGHAANISYIDVLNDKDVSLYCCKRWQEIVKELISAFGEDSYISLSNAYVQDLVENHGLIYVQREMESLSYMYARSLEPLIYLYYEDIENAEQNAKEYLNYVLENEPAKFAEEAINLASSFEEYGYKVYAYSMLAWAFEKSNERNELESAEIIYAESASLRFRMGDMEGAYKMASLGSSLFDFKNAKSYILNMITLARVCMYYFYDYESALKYLNDGLSVFNGKVPESQAEYPEFAKYTIKNAKPADSLYSSQIKSNMVDAYWNLERYSDAKELLSEELDVYRDSTGIIKDADMPYASNNLSRLARINFYESNYSEAIDILTQIYSYRKKYNYSTTDILDGLISTYSKLHEADSTSKYLNLYVAESISDYMKASSEMTADYRYMMWDNQGCDHIGMYGASCTAFDDGLPSSYYDLALAYKGFLLKYSGIIENNIIKSDDEVLKKAYLDYKEARMRSADDTNDKEWLCMSLYSKHPEFYKSYISPSWRDVRLSLQPKTAAIEFVVTWGNTKEENTYGALILTPKSKQPVYVKLCLESELNKLAEDFQLASQVASRKNNPVYAGELMTEYNHKIYDLIWSKILPYVKTAKTIVFAPYGVLNQMNIEVACNKKSIRVSSTADILDDQKIQEFNGSVLYGGLRYKLISEASGIESNSRAYNFSDTLSVTRSGWGYLSGTKEEVDNIAALLKNHIVANSVYSEADGTEMSFKKLSGKEIPIIHIATHGFYFNNELALQEPYFSNSKDDNENNISPMGRSGLIMSGGEDTWKGRVSVSHDIDNILLSEEIAGLYLPNTELLVLSACQTALGDISGDGVYGLQRAFKLAGAKSIIMSLWEVNDDATKIMMTNLYQQLLLGKTKRDSFNYAIQRVREWNDNPYYWAAFIMLD